MSEFVESDHPRDDIGRFTDGGPSSSEVRAPGLKTETHPTLGKRVRVHVEATEGEKGLRLSIDKDGIATLHASPFLARDKEYIRYRAFRAVHEFLWPYGENTYVRVSNKKEDYQHLKNKTHRGSKNHATEEDEGGLSVARDLEYSANYAYLVKGKVIGSGSDSEPLLETNSAEVASKQMKFSEMRTKLKEDTYKKAKEKGLDESDVRTLLSAVDYDFTAKPKQQKADSVLGGSASIAQVVEAVTAADTAPIAPQAGPAGRAAGILFKTADGDVLFMHRGDGGDYPRTWGFPGGHQEDGETLEACARREVLEETGLNYTGPLKLLIDDGQFATFGAWVDERFPVTLCDESVGYSWGPMPPELAHPGVREALRVAGASTELDIAKLIRDRVLPSPQLYHNVLLLDLRITGTGQAFRAEKVDADGKILSEAQHVYRDAALYLTDEFLQRCNGLPVILDHPEQRVLNAKEFRDRSSGSVMLPYIKGDEVWAIARIYAQDAIDVVMTAEEVSTSPTVVFGDESGNVEITLDSGEPLLIEGKPALIDHIALCGRGVWDKGGPAAGVSLNNEELVMADSVEEAKAKADAEEKRFAAMIKAAVSGAVADATAPLLAEVNALKAKAVADSEAAAKEKSEKEKADAEAKEKADAEEKAKADSAAAEKEKADAEEKAKADAAKADMDSSCMADAQAKADSVFAAYGTSAPRHLQGETVQAYRKRLLKPLQKHSASWKDVDLATINADAVLSIAETAIYADAMTAARSSADVPEGQLREVKRRNASGHMISEFHGDWRTAFGAFVAPARQLTINKNAGAH